MTLVHFHDDVPVLYVEDGRRYVPVIAICRMVGIHADNHIPRWRTLVWWMTARKLSLRTPNQSRRLVWCLPVEDLHFLYLCFDWQLVSPERRIQLRQAVEEGSKISELVYQHIQNRHQARRRFLFTFLTNVEDTLTRIRRDAEKVSPLVDNESCTWLDTHVEYGHSLFMECAVYARQVVRDRANLPLVDALLASPDGNVIETFSMPLLPGAPREESEQLDEYIRQLTSWYQDMVAFLKDKGFQPDRA